MGLKAVSRAKANGGWTEFHQHESQACSAPMRFSIYLPPQAATRKVPVLYWLSGLTCSEENFMVKAGAQRTAAELGIAIVSPDTSPRGLNLPGETASWDFGLAAGFYVNATQEPWSKNYRMYDYVTEELPALVRSNFSVDGRQSISGHSMGGHGALVAALRNPGRYASVSAFAPICAPSLCPWGQKAFTGYLGADPSAWEAYDTCKLVERASTRQELFVDQGEDDKFLTEQLMPGALEKACFAKDFPLKLRRQPGYDHSYYFISTFIEEHLRYHSEHLK